MDLERVRKGWGEVSIGVDAFYERCRPLVESVAQVVETLARRSSRPADRYLYVTGGGSELPPVARVLRETFGRRVQRSAYMRSATAIGLAIRAEGHEDRPLRDRSRKILAFGGRRTMAATCFRCDLPARRKASAARRAAAARVRSYRPVHNIGYFRYLECVHLGTNNQPEGEITNWDEIRVPLIPTARFVRSCRSTCPSLTPHRRNY